jgi:methylglutamate dehydrogenase subunit D
MPDVILREQSPLAGVGAYVAPGISVSEEAGFTLMQVAGFGKAFEKDLASVIGKLPGKVGVAQGNGEWTILRIAPQQVWCVGKAALPPRPGSCLVTALSSARCRIRLEGNKCRAVLSRAAPVDFSARSFKTGHFVMTGIHHTPVLIHCIGTDTVHVYAMRTFALGVWKWLVDAAEGLRG